jgi:hypothetical protein
MALVELHKLNGDTSWLVRLPRDPTQDAEDSAFYNLVLDPWLHPTPQVDGSPIFSRQTRIEPASSKSLAELDHWLSSQSTRERIDAVLFSHPFSDHLHEDSISDADSLGVLQRATIFTTGDSLSAFRSLKIAKSLYRSKIIDISSAMVKRDADQHSYTPSGISVEHLPAKDWAMSPAWSKLHGGILISCSNGANTTQILYSPHGMTPKSLPASLMPKDAAAGKQEQKRVLIHSFDRQTLPLIGTVACGFPNIIDLMPTFKPDIVLATHDEHKRGEGIVGRLLSREAFALQEAKRLVEERHPDSGAVLKQLQPGEYLSIS